ncbi:MAG: M14 family metallopeptidase [Bacteroidota bacterium]
MNRIILLLGLLFVLAPDLYPQQAFLFHDQPIAPGTKHHFRIPISDEKSESFIPISIFHGKEKGPVLGITAGVHGYEYPPIMAGQQLIRQIDPQKLSGTIILVQIANAGGFLGRTPYLNPLDGKNLNRSFPGKADGTITERIADYISREVIAKCDYFLDMHGGDAPESLMPYAAYYQHDQFPEISEKGKAMATHMGFDHIVVFRTTQKDYMKAGHPSTYCSAQAFKLGIPAVDIECGKLGLAEDALVQKIVSAVDRILIHLTMLEGEATVPTGIAFIEERSYLSSEHNGLFYSMKKSGDYVKKGMQLGYITDFFGQKIQDIYADQDGVILLIIGTPPINQAETLAVIGIIN